MIFHQVIGAVIGLSGNGLTTGSNQETISELSNSNNLYRLQQISKLTLAHKSGGYNESKNDIYAAVA